MTRPSLNRGLWAALALLAASTAASAKVYLEWQPRVTVGAGYDNNILLDGQGGDGFGQILPGLKLNLFGDHGLKSTIDCSVGFSRLERPEQYPAANGDLVLNQLCAADFRSRLGTRTALKFDLKTQYAQDPFSVANLGLLLRPGQRNIFHSRFGSELSYRNSEEGTTLVGLDQESLYFTPGDPGNGLLLTPHVAYEHRMTAFDTVSLGLREQLFFGLGKTTVAEWSGGSTGIDTAVLAGYKRRLSAIAELAVYAGPSILSRPTGQTFLPVGRAELELATPTNGLHLAVFHDVVLGPTLGGPLLGDNAEAAVFQDLVTNLRGTLRGGIYRNETPDGNGSVLGYGAGVGLDYRIGRAWILGATAARDARLGGADADHIVDRNVFQLRLTWESPRDW